MTILIADSSIKIIDRLESLIVEADNKLKIYKALTFAEALELFDEFNPEVVLLDMKLPADKSLHLLKLIKQTGSRTCIIALYSGVQYYQLGVDYFLDKHNEFEKIPGLIKDIKEKNEMSIKIN